MFELLLALRNLRRNKRRTLLTAVVIAFGILLHAFLGSLLTGFEEESARTLVKYETGEVALTAPGYWAERKELPLATVIPGALGVADRVRRAPGVRGAVPRLVFQAMVNNGTDELPVKAIGTDPRLDRSVLALQGTVQTGRYLRPGREEAVLGRGVADLMDLKAHDTFTLVLRNQGTTFEALDLTVAGILNAPDPAVNEGTVYLPLDVAQRLTGLGDAATEILVAGREGYTRSALLREQLASDLAQAGPGLEVHTWEEAAADLLAMSKAKRWSIGLTIGLIIVLAGLGVTNNVLLAGYERVREIGTLRALGLTEAQVTRVFMLEGLGVGFLGGLLGAVAALPAVAYLVLVGLDYRSLVQSNIGLPILGILRGVWNLPTILGAWAAASVFSYLVSYFPARWAARLDPATALRH
ncbi:MAG TPA: ABC transporter permease [Firmicutes bacterium]|nr:ABC transporter permease [Bacillota bacterium]